jgi:UDP-N-acetylglucosamine:LPS N-acetylglucosamine transferase
VTITPKEQQVSDVMIISRGHGRGHAVPDMAIATALTRARPELHLSFVSYAAGADAYRACGFQVLDLDKPDLPPFMDMVITFTRLFTKDKPHLIVAHEEFGVLPVAKEFGIPCLYVTDFFADPTNFFSGMLKDAAEVIFTAGRGLFTEPPFLRDKIRYVGRAVRPFKYDRANGEQARKELGIPENALVVLCQPGAWNESQVPLADLLSSAWNLMLECPKRLIWIGGRDQEALAVRFRQDSSVTVLKEDWRIDRLMAASDMLITKANRMTVYEAAAIGLPSISISSFVNWPDDVAVAHVESNTPISKDSISPGGLAKLILDKVRSKVVPATEDSQGVLGTVDRILYHIDRIRRNESSGGSLKGNQ